MGRLSTWLGIGALLVLPACSATEGADDTEAGGSSGDVEPAGDDDRTDGLPPVAEIFIPMRPQSTAELYSVPVLTDDGDGPRLQFDATLTLAVGDAYPAEFIAVLPEAWWGPCGPGAGPLRLSSLTTGGDAVSVALRDPATIVLTDYKAERTTTITGLGEVTLAEETCGLASGTVVSIDFGLSVSTKAIGGGLIEAPCSEPVVIAPFARDGAGDRFAWSWFYATLVDLDGEPMVVDNAERNAQVDVQLRGAFDAGHASPTEMGEWVAPSQPGLVEITPAGGSTLTVDVADATRVTGATLNFQIAGAGAGSLLVDSGETYDKWARLANRLAPMVQEIIVDGRPLCSQPDPRWFSVHSGTPQTCSIVELRHPHDDPAALEDTTRDNVGAAARLDQDGPCEVVVQAPDFSPSAGFPRRLSANFLNVESLLD